MVVVEVARDVEDGTRTEVEEVGVGVAARVCEEECTGGNRVGA